MASDRATGIVDQGSITDLSFGYSVDQEVGGTSRRAARDLVGRSSSSSRAFTSPSRTLERDCIEGLCKSQGPESAIMTSLLTLHLPQVSTP